MTNTTYNNLKDIQMRTAAVICNMYAESSAADKSSLTTILEAYGLDIDVFVNLGQDAFSSKYVELNTTLHFKCDDEYETEFRDELLDFCPLSASGKSADRELQQLYREEERYVGEPELKPGTVSAEDLILLTAFRGLTEQNRFKVARVMANLSAEPLETSRTGAHHVNPLTIKGVNYD